MATVNEILTRLDDLKPNQYDDSMKIKWLSDLDEKIISNVIDTHRLNEDEEYPEFNGYSENDMEAELLVPDEFTELYIHYLAAKIDFYNNETSRYTNSMIMFNSAYSEYTSWYNRKHMPLSDSLKV